MTKKSIEEAATELGAIVDAARLGEITVLTRDGQAAAVVASGHCAIEPLRAALSETMWGHGDGPMIVPRSELGRWFRDMVAASESGRKVEIAERGRVFIKVLPPSAIVERIKDVGTIAAVYSALKNGKGWGECTAIVRERGWLLPKSS